MTDINSRPFEPGEPLCHNCGTAVTVADPGPHERCPECKAHLRHCRNCMFRIPSGCLLQLKHRWPASGLPGQDCPRFLWRDNQVAADIEDSDASSWDEERSW